MAQSILKPNKSLLFSLLSAGILILLLMELNGAYTPQRVAQYIKKSPEVAKVFTDIQIVRLNDMPGFSSALGYSSNRKEVIENARLSEEEQWESLSSFLGYRFIVDSSRLKCASKTHVQKLEFFNQVENLAAQYFFQTSDADKLFAQMIRISKDAQICGGVAMNSTPWATRLWAKIVSLVEDGSVKLSKLHVVDETSQSSIIKSVANNGISQAPDVSSVKESNPEQPISTTVSELKFPTTNLKLLRFEDIAKIDLAKLTNAQKQFLKGKGQPVEESDNFDGVSGGTYKPGVGKIGNSGDQFVLTATHNMVMSDGSDTTNYDLYNLNKLSPIPVKDFTSVEANDSSYILFAIHDNTLVGIVKIKTSSLGNSKHGNLKCTNTGAKYFFNEITQSITEPIEVELGSECPAVKGSSNEYDPENSAYNEKQRKIILNSLLEKLIAAIPDQTSQCRTELKQYVISDVGVFTKENEKAIDKNCDSHAREFLCFTAKAREITKQVGNVSMAEQGNLYVQCGIR